MHASEKGPLAGFVIAAVVAGGVLVSGAQPPETVYVARLPTPVAQAFSTDLVLGQLLEVRAEAMAQARQARQQTAPRFVLPFAAPAVSRAVAPAAAPPTQPAARSGNHRPVPSTPSPARPGRPAAHLPGKAPVPAPARGSDRPGVGAQRHPATSKKPAATLRSQGHRHGHGHGHGHGRPQHGR
ncbi:MAG TPA: hypothetical protein VFO98_08730 [Marmoricola sp.]|nr:hypothetical protein [Marmoricola sp.]